MCLRNWRKKKTTKNKNKTQVKTKKKKMCGRNNRKRQAVFCGYVSVLNTKEKPDRQRGEENGNCENEMTKKYSEKKKKNGQGER